jgi:hypothetical protein
MRHARFRLFGVLAAVVLLAASCDWPLDGFGPDRTGYDSLETTISPSNVGQLSQQWTASLVGPGSDTVVADGHVFVTAWTDNGANNQLYAFDASGSTNCTGTPPKSCSPQWSVTQPFLSSVSSAPGVSGGMVWNGIFGPGQFPHSGSLNAYNESTGALTVSGGMGTPLSPAVTGNTVYADWADDTNPSVRLGGLEALDATTGAPTVYFGDSNSPNDYFQAPAVANGILYAVAVGSLGLSGTLEAFDATGKTNCGPLPAGFPVASGTFCSPLWSAPLSGPLTSTNNPYPAVANGYVYIADESTLSAFPAGGCGAATCSPAWTAKANVTFATSVAVTPTTLFVGSGDGVLYAYPATGCGATTCQPLWQAQTSGAVPYSPSVAGDVVYMGSDDDNLYAFNASGCGAATCTPLWQTNVGAPVETSPAIANGQVFVADAGGTLHAYGLPAAPSS